MTTPATYRITDDNGTTAEGLLFLTVGKGPQAAADTATTKQNVTVAVDPLANDEPGTDAATREDVGPAVRRDGAELGAEGNDPGQGVFTVNEVTGRITFDPVPTYRGVASIAYRVTDTSRNTAASTVAVTVQPIVPVAADDAIATPYDTAVTVAVLKNDKPGDATAPLGEVRLIDPATGDAVPSLDVPGQGTFVVQPDGGIRFAPVDGFVGAANPVGYQVADRNGTIGSAALTVTVQARPVATPDAARTKQHVPVTVDPLANDKPGPGASLDPETLLLIGPDAALVDQVTVAGEGDWVVAKGKVTFSPVATFTGTARPAAYVVKDSNRNAARATITVTVAPVRPVTVDDSARTGFGKPVRRLRAGQRQAGRLVRAARAGFRRTAGSGGRQGQEVGDRSGRGRFRGRRGRHDHLHPGQGLHRYDANRRLPGHRRERHLERRAAGGHRRRSDPGQGDDRHRDRHAGEPGRGQPAAERQWCTRRRTVCLRTGPATCAKRVTDASGTWSVANDGTISLAPAAGFTGTAKATYEQTDAIGGTVAAPVRFTIGAQPAADLRSVNRAQIPATGGPPPMLLTLGALLTALGATLAAISRRRSR